jgi:hypothetical protein
MSRFSIPNIVALGVVATLLTACGGTQGDDEQSVTMRDMEVVDGTASDAMTDLDGVQSESLALPPAPTATRPAAAETSNSTAEAEVDASEETTADQ